MRTVRAELEDLPELLRERELFVRSVDSLRSDLSLRTTGYERRSERLELVRREDEVRLAYPSRSLSYPLRS